MLASGSGDGTIRVWDSSTGACLKSWNAHDKLLVNAIAFAPGWSCTSLASGGSDKLVKIWDTAADYALLYILQGHKEPVTAVSFIDSNTLLSLSRDETVRRWDLTEGTLLSTIPIYREPLAVSPNGRFVATKDGEQRLQVLDLDHPELCNIAICGHIRSYCHVVFFPDNTRLVSSPIDRDEIKIWDSVTGSCLYSFAGSGVVAISADGTRMASGSKDDSIKTWDSVKGSLLQAPQSSTTQVMTFSFSPDGKQLASGCVDGMVRIWDPTIESSPQLQNLAGWYTDLYMSPDGLWIASTGWEGSVRIWDTATSEHHHTIGDIKSQHLIAFSPNSLWMAAASNSKQTTVNICEIRTGKVIHRCSDHLDDIGSLMFSPDGLWLAFGFGDGSVTMRDTRTWELRHTLKLHDRWVTSMAFSPQARDTLLALSSFDGHINIWAIDTGAFLKTFECLDGLGEMKFSPNGLWLAAACRKTIGIWDVNQGSFVKRVSFNQFREMSWHPSGNILDVSNIGRLKFRLRIKHISDEKRPVCNITKVAPEVDLSPECTWILVGGKRAICLPAQYRPQNAWNIDRPKVVTGHSSIGIVSNSRRVLFFQFVVSERDVLWA